LVNFVVAEEVTYTRIFMSFMTVCKPTSTPS